MQDVNFSIKIPVRWLVVGVCVVVLCVIALRMMG